MKLPAIIRKGGPLLAAPLSLVLHYTSAAPPVWIFLAGLIAIAVLADWVRRGTELRRGGEAAGAKQTCGRRSTPSCTF